MKNDLDILQRSMLSRRAATDLLKRHLRNVAASTLLPSATPEQREVALRNYSDEQLFSRAKRACESTVERTDKRARSVFAAAMPTGANVWVLVEQRSGNYDSWYTFKAGVQRYLETEIVGTKDQLDAWQRDRKLKGVSPQSDSLGARLLMQLDQFVDALQQVPSEAPERFRGDGKSKRYTKNSKSHSIRTTTPDWRELVAKSMSEELRLPFLMQCVTGCRPEELEKGVQIRLLRDGTLVTRVKGAKTDEVSGQPSRCMKLAASDGIAMMLAQQLKVGVTLQSGSCNIGLVNTYARKVARACAKAFPERVGKAKLSAYSTRHQFKADLVAAGWDATAIAMAMGHSTTRTGTAYGRGGRGGGGGVKPSAVKARRVVKQRAQPPMVRNPAPSIRATASGQRTRRMRP